MLKHFFSAPTFNWVVQCKKRLTSEYLCIIWRRMLISAYEKQKEAHKYDFNYFYGIKLLLNRLAKNGSYEHERHRCTNSRRSWWCREMNCKGFCIRHEAIRPNTFFVFPIGRKDVRCAVCTWYGMVIFVHAVVWSYEQDHAVQKVRPNGMKWLLQQQGFNINVFHNLISA